MIKTFDFHIIIGPNLSANIRPLYAVCRMAPSYTKFSENDMLVYGHVKSGFWVDWHQCALADGTGNPWYSVCLLRIAGRVQDTITSWLRPSRSHLLSDRVTFTKPDCMIREMNYHTTSGIIHTESKSSNISHLVLRFSLPNPLRPGVKLIMCSWSSSESENAFWGRMFSIKFSNKGVMFDWRANCK